MQKTVKQAKEAFSRGLYQDCIYLYDQALEAAEPERRYSLMILKGAAQQHLNRTEDATGCLLAAANLQPEQPLAWHGLVSVYERTEEWSRAIEPLEKLAAIYKRSRDLDSHLAATQKLIDYATWSENDLKLMQYLEWICSEEASVFYSKENVCTVENLEKLVSLLEAKESDYISRQVQIQRSRLNAEPLPLLTERIGLEVVKQSKLDFYLWRLVMKKESHGEKLIERLFRKIPVCNDAELVRRYKSLCQKYSPSRYQDLLDDPEAQSSGPLMQLFRQLSALFDEGSSDFFRVFKDMQGLLAFYSKNFHAEYAKVQEKCIEWNAISLLKHKMYPQAEKALLPLKKHRKLYVDALLAQEKYIEAIKEIEAQLALGRTSELLMQLGWIRHRLGHLSEAEALIREASVLSPSSSESVYRLGCVLWDMDIENRKNRSVCHDLFLEAAKNSHPGAFFYLGQYFEQIEHDFRRGERCYIKSLQLDAECVDAAIGLARIWMTGEDACAHGLQTISMLEGCIELRPRSSPLWQFLGIAYGLAEERQKAVSSFQNSLKGEDCRELACLLLLAEAYQNSKKYTAALKAYSRACEVEPTNLVARIGVARLKGVLKQYESAIEDFEQIQKDCKTVKYGRTILDYARDLMLESKFPQAIELIQKLFQSDDSDKVFADACMLLLRFVQIPDGLCALLEIKVASLSKALESIEIVQAIVSAKSNIAAVLGALYSLSSLSNCVQKSVSKSFWTDLGTFCFRLGGSDLLAVAEDCAMEALRADSQYSPAWNLLGLAKMAGDGDKAEAQHCFIKALLNNSNGSSYWVNLASFYNTLGDFVLVQKCLERAQLAGAEFCAAWYAYAEMVELGLFHDKRHYRELLEQAISCADASLHAASNYKYWKETTSSGPLSKILLQRIAALDPSKAIWNQLGLVLELSQEYSEAMQAYQMASADENYARAKFQTGVLPTEFSLSSDLGKLAKACQTDESLLNFLKQNHSSPLWNCAVKIYCQRLPDMDQIKALLAIDPENENLNTNLSLHANECSLHASVWFQAVCKSAPSEAVEFLLDHLKDDLGLWDEIAELKRRFPDSVDKTKIELWIEKSELNKNLLTFEDGIW